MREQRGPLASIEVAGLGVPFEPELGRQLLGHGPRHDGVRPLESAGVLRLVDQIERLKRSASAPPSFTVTLRGARARADGRTT
jgi:hypothetical protein